MKFSLERLLFLENLGLNFIEFRFFDLVCLSKF